jgi:hypothetical protein
MQYCGRCDAGGIVGTDREVLNRGGRPEEKVIEARAVWEEGRRVTKPTGESGV